MRFRDRYKGRAYDGPLEGQQLESEYSHYPFNHAAQLSLRDLMRMRDVPDVVSFDRWEYRWSAPLRAWVFVWPQ